MHMHRDHTMTPKIEDSKRNSPADLRSGPAAHLNVLGALLLRDIRSRMMGSWANYLRFIAFPLLHLLSLIAFNSVVGKAALLGTDKVVFFASGILPFILFVYPIRSNVLCIGENRPLLVFPVVNPIDIILARCALEIINSFAIILILSIILYFAGYDMLPRSPFKTLSGIFMTILFSLAFSVPNAVIARLVTSNWVQTCAIFGVGLYIGSGALFLPSQMPPIVRELMYFNPLAHCVEWVRSGYYETYNEGLLDRAYLIKVIVILLSIGLGMERFLRGKLS